MPKVKDLKKDELSVPEYYEYEGEMSPEYPEGTSRGLGKQFPDCDKSDLDTGFKVQIRKG